MKTVLLTGATGFLGSHIAKALIDNHFRVLAYCREQTDFSRLESVKSQIRWYQIAEGLELPFKSATVDHIIHTATNYGRNQEANSLLAETNLVFPLKLFELSEQYNINIFINTDTVLHKYLNAYALSKKQLCEWLKLFSKNTRVLNIKLEHIYGPHDDASKFVTGMINQCQSNVNNIALTLGEQKRDFVYIDDAVDAYIKLLGHADQFSSHYSDLELGSGQAISIRHLVETIHRLTQSYSVLNFGALPYRDNEIMESVADCSELKKIGWLPRHSLEAGLKKTLTT